MKKRHIAGGAIIVIFLIYSLTTFSSALTPYVGLAQARTAPGAVQVRGVLASDKIAVFDNGRTVAFTLKDEAGNEALIVYSGVRPDRLDHATSIVAVGTFRGDRFMAEKLLVKCPSKYQGSVKQ